MRKKEAKISSSAQKPREPKPGATAKPAEKPKTSTTPRTKPSAKPTPKPKPVAKSSDKPSAKPKNKLYPEGTKLRCVVYYYIQYIGPYDPVKYEEPFEEPCKLVFSNPIIDLPLSIAAARHARAELWENWVSFRKNKELHPPVNAPAKIDSIFIIKTEYYTDKTKDRRLTTKFIDEFIRSVSGYSEIPRNF